MVEENFEIWLFGTLQKRLILLYYIVILIISENQLNSKLIPNIPSGQPNKEWKHMWKHADRTKKRLFFFSKIFDPPKKICFRPKYFSSKNKILKKKWMTLWKMRENYRYNAIRFTMERTWMFGITEITTSVLQWNEYACSELYR